MDGPAARATDHERAQRRIGEEPRDEVLVGIIVVVDPLDAG